MNIQNRILLGIGFFVGILLLVGWAAINEPARMSVFTSQWEGRSLERGADLFLAYCATCHGEDGLGQGNMGPALKNPYLFATDNPAMAMVAEIKSLTEQKQLLSDALTQLEENVAELAAKTKSLALATDFQKTAIQAEIDALEAAIQAFGDRAATEQKIDDLTNQIAGKEAELAELKAQGWDEKLDVRLRQVRWQGSLEGYIRSTIVGGRPVSAQYWSNPMPAWGEEANGSLRKDEVENLTRYIVNWREEALKLTPSDLRQNYKIPVDSANVPSVNKEFLGDAVDVLTLDLAGGDAAAGQAKYDGAFACKGCHNVAGGAAFTVAPTVGTITRVENVRLKVAELSSLTVDQYLAQSILYPGSYLVPGGQAVMPAGYGLQMDIADLRDIIAYLRTQ